ncbi:hypothetical protein SynBIOSU31_03250 [Synechococcus sp. BIOS-U3-1]|nr:hypothetical protein SynBIOSU31_03250 [Synechococcus sp. BIOS-U3-1]
MKQLFACLRSEKSIVVNEGQWQDFGSILFVRFLIAFGQAWW